MGRTDAVARFAGHELLHGTVLERVERDDREAATRSEDAHGGLEAAREVAELVVHRDAEGLEDAGRRIDLPGPAGLHARDEATELVRGHERAARPAAHDRARDARGLGLFTELGEDPPEVALIPGVHQVRRRAVEPRVGPHVEGAGGAKAEPAALVGELDRREPEVEEDPVDTDEVVLAGHVVENREI